MSTNVPEEIAALAQHQLEILERRFPNHKHSIQGLGSNNCCLIVANNNKYCLLQISFRSNSIEILPSFASLLDNLADHLDGRPRNMLEDVIILDYADPRFTDDTISDIIKTGHMSC